MTTDFAPINLTNHFLIAMPGLVDLLFAKSVIYVCEHSDRGALGLIINKPGNMTIDSLFEKVDLSLRRTDLMGKPVFYGGPVQMDRGFVLHDPLFTEETKPEEPLYASTLTIPGGLEMTTSRDILEALAMGAGPQRVFLSLGYAAWGEGQLESELKENSWLTVTADHALIFDTPIEQRYDRALALLGLEAWMISTQAGRA